MNITNFTITNGTITGNAYGGGIYNNGNLTMTNCNINNNKATVSTHEPEFAVASGGGIYNDFYGTLTMTNCNIQNNTATATTTGAPAAAYGGGIYNYGGTLIMTNCNIQNNTATATTTGAPAVASGGGIYNGGMLTMTSCNINNTATATSTGATYAHGGGIYNGGTLTVNFSRIVGNAPQAIYNNGVAVRSLEDNWWGSNNPVFSNLLFNVPDSTHTNWLYLTANATPSIIDNGATSLITSSFNNRCNGSTVTPFVPTGNNHIPDDIPVTFSSLLGSVNPVIAFTLNGLATTTFTPTCYSGIAIVNATTDNQTVNTIINVTNAEIYVSNNTGSDTNGDGSQGNPYQTILKGITMVSPDGNVYIAEGTYTGTSNTGITISKSLNIIGQSLIGTIINGTSTAGIFNITSGVTATINNLTFVNGTAPHGGAIANNGTLIVNGCAFIGNIGTSSDHSVGGGAIYNGGILTVNDSTFTNNTGTFGGAIENDHTNLTVNNCTFTGNTATMDSNIIDNWYGNVTITGSNFTGHMVASPSSGIGNYNGNMTVTGCTFTDNNATTSGGALWNTNGSNLTVTNCTFTDNSATDGGAAIANAGNITVTTSNFIGNTATSNGGAIWNEGTAYVNFNRFVGNTATINGTAIYNAIGSMNATNNWWDSNNPDFTNLIHVVSGSVNNDTWVILTVNATPTTINYNETSTLTADFNHINGGNPLTGGHIPDGPITLYIPWGSFTDPGTTHFVTLNTVTGAIIPTTFYANKGPVNPFYNPVKVTASADEYTTNDTESAYIYINKVANLSITKTAPTTVLAGTPITYTITIINNGPDPAENVALNDTLLTGLSAFNTGSLQYRFKTNDGDWSVWSDWTNPSNPLSLNLGTILNGKNGTIQINGTINSSTTQGTVINNTATTNTTTTPGNKNVFKETTVNTQSDVVLTKVVDNPRPNVGDTVTFTVTAHNNGPSDTNNIQIQDIMPSDFTDVVITSSKGTYSDLTRIWTLNITSGESATLNLTGKVTSVMAGKNTTNNATLIGSTQKANATIYVPKANLYIQITSNNNNPTVGETFTLRYKLGNYGPDDALNVTITIPIPDGFVISKIEGDGNWTIVGNSIIWTMNNVTVGDPDLYVSGWTKWAGSFQFGASILSDTFNLNSQGVSSFSLNAVPQVNAATTTTNTGKTVGMQTTGAPIVPLAFAVLSLLGGLVATRKKQ